jgi:hypothetical protein
MLIPSRLNRTSPAKLPLLVLLILSGGSLPAGTPFEASQAYGR